MRARFAKFRNSKARVRQREKSGEFIQSLGRRFVYPVLSDSRWTSWCSVLCSPSSAFPSFERCRGRMTRARRVMASSGSRGKQSNFSYPGVLVANAVVAGGGMVISSGVDSSFLMASLDFNRDQCSAKDSTSWWIPALRNAGAYSVGTFEGGLRRTGGSIGSAYNMVSFRTSTSVNLFHQAPFSQ